MKYRRKLLRSLFKQKDKYYPSDYYYEKLFKQHNETFHYTNLITSVKSKMKIDSQSMITFNDNEFNNFTKKDITKQYGKPKYRVITNNEIKTETFFYRLCIGGYKAKLELHFHNNCLFFYSYIFSHPSENQKKQIVNLLEKKYLNEQPFDYNTSIIIDDNQSALHITELVDFTINYICCIESDIFQNIENINSMKKLLVVQKQKKNAEELYQKL